MKHSFAAFTLAISLAAPALAEEITSRDDLMAYLKDKMPDGQEISQSFEVDDTLFASRNNGGCLTPRTLQQLPFIARILVDKGLMFLQVTEEVQGYTVIGGGPACKYRVSHFNLYELELFGAQIEPGDGLSGEVKIPLMKQRLLGVTDVDLQGYTSLGDTSCDIAFKAWFESYEPSYFAKEFRNLFLDDYRHKNVFSEEFETGTWCLQRHYDGTYKWKHWSRL
ncbi:MAG: hypothetical protein ABJN52_04105 [Litorimonas sp.]